MDRVEVDSRIRDVHLQVIDNDDDDVEREIATNPILDESIGFHSTNTVKDYDEYDDTIIHEEVMDENIMFDCYYCEDTFR